MVWSLLRDRWCYLVSRGPLLEALFSWFCERIPSLKTRMERRIDIAVILNGYGNELLAFRRYHDQYYEPYDQTDGYDRQRNRGSAPSLLVTVLRSGMSPAPARTWWRGVACKRPACSLSTSCPSEAVSHFFRIKPPMFFMDFWRSSRLFVHTMFWQRGFTDFTA